MFGSVVIFGKAKAEISIVPSQSGSLTYNGSALTPAWNGFNAGALEIGGTTSAVNAGTYTATFTPKDGYVWSDGTTGAKSVAWTIGRAAIAVPRQSGSLTYTGKALTPVFSGYDSAKMTMGGTTKATDAGTHNATFTLNANFQWSDGTTAVKTVSWTIGKAAGSLSLDKTALALGIAGKTGQITVTRAGDGAVSAASSNTGVAAVTVSGNVITVTGAANGSATITVKVAAGKNHTAPADKTCTVTVQFPSAVLNANDWATIRAVSDAGEGENYWDVGDTKQITIDGTVGSYTFSHLLVDAFIIGFNHNSAKEGTNRIHFQIGKRSGKDICLCDSNYGQVTSSTSSNYFQMMNVSKVGGVILGDAPLSDGGITTLPEVGVGGGGINPLPETTYVTNKGGWKDSYMRKGILGSSGTPTSPAANSLMAALPSDLRAVMKSVTKYSDNAGEGTNAASNVTATTDYLFLPSGLEINGILLYANSAERNYQKQYDYYTAGNSEVKRNHDSTDVAVNYWSRSVVATSDANFCAIDYRGITIPAAANTSLGIAPIFVV